MGKLYTNETVFTQDLHKVPFSPVYTDSNNVDTGVLSASSVLRLTDIALNIKAIAIKCSAATAGNCVLNIVNNNVVLGTIVAPVTTSVGWITYIFDNELEVVNGWIEIRKMTTDSRNTSGDLTVYEIRKDALKTATPTAIEAFRTAVYAIAPWNGGRLISPMRTATMINYYDSNKTWTGSATAFNSRPANCSFEFGIIEKEYVADEYFIYGASKFYIKEYSSNHATYSWAISLASLISSMTPSEIDSTAIATTDNTNKIIYLKRSYTPINTEVLLKLVISGTTVELWGGTNFQNKLISIAAGSILTTSNTSNFTSTGKCNITTFNIKDTSSVVLWGSNTADSYSTWYPQISRPYTPYISGTMSYFGLAETLISLSSGNFSIKWSGRINVRRSTAVAALVQSDGGSYYVYIADSATSVPITVYVTNFMSTQGTWTILDATRIVSTAATSTRTYFQIASTYYTNGNKIEIECKRVGNVLNVYVDKVLSATYAGTAVAITNTTTFTSSFGFNGNTYEISVLDANSNIAWRTPETWESNSGLLMTTNIKALSGIFTPWVSSVASYILTQLDLRGSASSFTLVWVGTITDALGSFLQGTGSASKSVRLYYASAGLARFSIGNGSAANTADATVTDTTKPHVFVCVVDRQNLKIQLFCDTVSGDANTLTSGGSIDSTMGTTELRVYSGAQYFGYWNKALSTSEIAVLQQLLL